MIFKKEDREKIDLSLFEPLLMEVYCRVADMGAKKYGRNNWKNAKIEDYIRYVAAGRRHQLAADRGEMYDKESGIPHRYHALWNLFAQIWMEEEFGFYACNEQLDPMNATKRAKENIKAWITWPTEACKTKKDKKNDDNKGKREVHSENGKGQGFRSVQRSGVRGKKTGKNKLPVI